MKTQDHTYHEVCLIFLKAHGHLTCLYLQATN